MINIDKVKTISSYLAENVEGLYITKLMKLFYYIDFASYAIRKSPITNDNYYKLPYGPVPSFIKNEVDNLIFESDRGIKSQLKNALKAEPIKINSNTAYLLKNISDTFNIDCLSEFEFALVKKIAEKFKKSTAKELTEKTHKEPPYILTSENSIIDYELASKLDLKKIL